MNPEPAEEIDLDDEDHGILDQIWLERASENMEPVEEGNENGLG